MIVQANGTGKTATIAIIVLQKIDTSIRQCQALILAPTKELVEHIQQVCAQWGLSFYTLSVPTLITNRHFYVLVWCLLLCTTPRSRSFVAHYHRVYPQHSARRSKMIVALGEYMAIECMACVDDMRDDDEMLRLEAGVHCIVGTPDRVSDMMSRSASYGDHQDNWCRSLFASIGQCVLDEADEMMLRGFEGRIFDIFREIPVYAQVSCEPHPFVYRVLFPYLHHRLSHACVTFNLISVYDTHSTVSSFRHPTHLARNCASTH